ncbi:MAG: divalent metal cation transporter [Oligoflexales bacterium]|nr:divalent metal cation transporter [Oligoflexales bacterium]
MKSFFPDSIDFIAIVTIIGGTVGGYVPFSGGHRLLDAGIKGKEAMSKVTASSASAIGIASIMRILLFLATLGVVVQGFKLDPANPPASVFQLAAGSLGYRMFGIIMWAAAVTSVIGAAYTSVSFIKTFHPLAERYSRELILAFISVSTIVFVLVGKPVKVLILVGVLNGLILPVSLGVMLIAAYRPSIVRDYRHPLWMTLFGIVVVVAMTYMGIMTIMHEVPKLFM